MNVVARESGSIPYKKLLNMFQIKFSNNFIDKILLSVYITCCVKCADDNDTYIHV